jgi:probable HAF family extracellular repeat protein
MKDLGTLGGSESWGRAINDIGEVTGGSETAGGVQHAFLYSAWTGMEDLGTLGGSDSFGYGINKLGQVTGWSLTAGDGAWHAFLYSAGNMMDLNALIAPSSGWTLTLALGINDLGQITGYGSINGQEHAFLMTPAH